MGEFVSGTFRGDFPFSFQKELPVATTALSKPEAPLFLQTTNCQEDRCGPRMQRGPSLLHLHLLVIPVRFHFLSKIFHEALKSYALWGAEYL